MAEKTGYARLPRTIWDEVRFRGLTEQGRLLYLLLRTGPSSWSCGLYRTTVMGLAGDLNWSLDRTESRLEEVTATGLVEWDPEARVVFVPAAVTDFPPMNPKMVSGWILTAEQIPPSRLVRRWAETVARSVNRAWIPMLSGLLTLPIHEPAPVQTTFAAVDLAFVPEPVPDRTADALRGWNEATGQELRSTSFLTLAHARMAEGHSVEDLVLVARWAAHGPRSAWFRGDNDRKASYLRPATMWSPSKFDSYLEDARAWDGQAVSPGRQPAVAGEFAVSEDEDEAKVRAMNVRLASRKKGPSVPDNGTLDFE